VGGAPEDSPLMTVREVARLFRKTPRTIWNWMHKKKLLEPVRVGGSVYCRRADVARLMNRPVDR
jgi:predicted DNA-binding transcriptional regulator AlpA